MPRFKVVHETRYTYQTEVSSSYGQLCMLPRDFPAQRCLDATVAIDPAPRDLRERTDFFGNRVTYFSVDSSHDVLRITASSDVEVQEQPTPATDLSSFATVRDRIKTIEGEDRIEATQYLLDSPRVGVDDRVRAYARASFTDDRPILDCLRDLCERIHREFDFDPTATTVTSTVDDLFTHGAGVCQDFAHLAVACLRAQGLPARYVSGYLETDPPPGKAKIVGADVSHAWASALIPSIGWVDFDPTNNQFINERYITTGWGRDYSDVSPLKGVIYSDGGQTELSVSVDVSKLE